MFEIDMVTHVSDSDADIVNAGVRQIARDPRNLPAVVNNDVGISSTLRVQKMLRIYVAIYGDHQFPDDITAFVRNYILDTTSTNDATWASSLVQGFYKVSSPLGLELDRCDYKEELGQTLLNRLFHDLSNNSGQFDRYRISSTRQAFNAMGEDFTERHQAKKIKTIEDLYERFDLMFRTTQANLNDILAETETEVSKLESHYARLER